MPELLHARPKQRRISLTPLVDVIFLLLIFFMLTSQIAPFSLISLSGIKAEDEATATVELPPNQSQPLFSAAALISVSNKGIAINGQRIANDELIEALAVLLNDGIEAVIISPRSSATVQDLISLLEIVKKSSFRSVTIRKSG